MEIANRFKTARVFWNINDPRMLGLEVSEVLGPDEDSIENAYLAAYRSFGLPRDLVGIVTLDLSKPKHRAALEKCRTLCGNTGEFCGCVVTNKKGAFVDVFMSDERPDELAAFNWSTRGWEMPENAGQLKREQEAEVAGRELMKAIMDAECRMIRPLAAITKALLNGTTPDPEDVNHFNYFHHSIEAYRRQLQETEARAAEAE